jgi:hypothetical protein
MKLSYLKVFMLLMSISINGASLAQEFTAEQEGRLINYIGRFNGEELFFMTSEKKSGNDGQIVVLDGIHFSNRMGLPSEEKLSYDEIFLAGEYLFCVTSRKTDDGFQISIRKFNKGFVKVNESVLFEAPDFREDEVNIFLHHDEHSVCVAGTPNKKGKQGFLAFLDLETDVRFTQWFSDDRIHKLRCADIVCNDKNDILAVFLGANNLSKSSALEKKESLCYVLSASSSASELKQVDHDFGARYLRGLLLKKLDEGRVLMGGITANDESNNMDGYYCATLRFGSTAVSEPLLPIAAEIQSPALWTEKDFIRIVDNKPIIPLLFQFLREIYPLEDGSYLFVSEAVYVQLSGGGATTMTPTNSTAMASQGIPSYQSGIGFNGYSPHSISAGACLQDIIVSRISASGEVLWTNKTKYRMDYSLPGLQGTSNTGFYVLHVDEQANKLMLYFPHGMHLHQPSGALLDKRKLTGYSDVENTIATMELELADGSGEVRTFFSDFATRRDETLIPACSFADTNGKIVLITARDITDRQYRRIVVE